MELALDITDIVFFTVLGLSTAYLFVFALFSMKKRDYAFPPTDKRHRITVFIPAYKEDAVIRETTASAMAQDYPADAFEVAVIADGLRADTVETLVKAGAKVIEVSFENSSKAASLKYAVKHMGDDHKAEIAVILDADNTVGRDFLSRINEAYHSGAMAMQAHRRPKNLDTDTAVLDAVSEEINNSIFRRGHVALGISAALSGSGMAFDYGWFRENAESLSTAGEDKELEVLLLKQGVFIEYLDHVDVMDEKTRRDSAFYNQRRRWLSAQVHSLASGIKDLPGAVLSGNIDYCDKLLQWMMPPRIILLGLVPAFGLLMLLTDPRASVKWWALLLALLLAMAMAIPDYLVDKRFKRAMHKIPVMFVLMAANIFRIGSNKNKFIHTAHGDATQHERKTGT